MFVRICSWPAVYCCGSYREESAFALRVASDICDMMHFSCQDVTFQTVPDRR